MTVAVGTTGRNTNQRSVTVTGPATSMPIMAIGAFTGITAVVVGGSGTAQLQVTCDPPSAVEAGTATFQNQGSALSGNKVIGNLGFTATAIQLVATTGAWTLSVASDNIS